MSRLDAFGVDRPDLISKAEGHGFAVRPSSVKEQKRQLRREGAKGAALLTPTGAITGAFFGARGGGKVAAASAGAGAVLGAAAGTANGRLGLKQDWKMNDKFAAARKRLIDQGVLVKKPKA